MLDPHSSTLFSGAARGSEMAFGAAPTGDAPAAAQPAAVTADGDDEGPPF
mgnify:CR=1 FL=1